MMMWTREIKKNITQNDSDFTIFFLLVYHAELTNHKVKESDCRHTGSRITLLRQLLSNRSPYVENLHH